MKTKNKIKLIKEIGVLLENNMKMYEDSNKSILLLNNDTHKLLESVLCKCVISLDLDNKVIYDNTSADNNGK